MEPALQRRIQRYGWDRAADHYEAYWCHQLEPAQDLLMELAQFTPGEEVVDIACGTGLVSFRAAHAVGLKGQVVATDISEKMVEIATIMAQQKGIPNIRFMRMDAEDLQLSDQSFDVALCALGLMYVPGPVKAIQEMHRVLKPGGRMVAAVWGQRDHCGWADLFEIVDKRVASEVCPMFFNLGNPDMLRLSMNAAGFSECTTKTISTVLHFDSAEQACGAAFAGGPVALAYHKFSEQVKGEAHSEYLASIEKYKKGNGYEVPGEFIVGRGVV